MKTQMYLQHEGHVVRRPLFRSRYTFSFGDWYAPDRMGFGALKVFNDDACEAGASIPMHPHENFEILSVILRGRMQHEDNLGNRMEVPAGSVKLMSAGSGLRHGGVTPEATEFFQIWVRPEVTDTLPTVRVRAFAEEERSSRWQLQVSPDGEAGSLSIRQRVYAWRGLFETGRTVEYQLRNPQHGVLLKVISGQIQVGDTTLQSRDALGLQELSTLSVGILSAADVWLMEIPLG